MTRQNKLIILFLYLLILGVALIAYRSNRAAKIARLHADLARVTAEQAVTRSIEMEVTRLMRLIPAESNSPAFIETLYRFARESGLKQHEVSSEADKASGSARPGGSTTSVIASQRLKISANGNYRSFAEYIRKVQNTEQFNRISSFKMTPETTQLKGTLTIELYSLPVKR